MKVLVTGKNGQLGFDVIERLRAFNIECLGTDRNQLDITDEVQVDHVISTFKPDVVIHCAAYTAVDRAEQEKELCFQVNVLGTKYIAQACKKNDAKLLYVSTDYVFDGTGEAPFQESDETNPINFYGETKNLGEIEIQKLMENYFIVRVSWVFGSNGNNFVKTMLRLSSEREELSVVADQIGSPSYTVDLAKLFHTIIQTEAYGIYHATNDGFCSWYEFACEIFEAAKITIKVNPILSKDFVTLAKRPYNSRLSKEKLNTLNIPKLPNWKEALSDYIAILSNAGKSS